MTPDTATEDLVDEAEEVSSDQAPVVEEELLVEEVSIDGMCGVY
jgi:mycofactocin precursor